MAKSIGKRLLEMLNGQIMTDVTFTVQGTEIKGHRAVVSSYGGPLREILETKAERVKIFEGVSVNTFKAVLQYLYTDECTIGNDNVFELLHAAKIFQLQDLTDRCVKLLTSKLTIKNIAAHTAQALHFDVKEYLRICMDYFRINTLEILNTKEFLEVSNEVLLELVSTEGIGCSELELFTACLEWAENDCRQKKMEPNAANTRINFGDVLNLIKFSNMSKDDFMSIVVPTNILTNEEVGKIINDWQRLPARLDSKAVKERSKQESSAKMGANAHKKQDEHQRQEDHPGSNKEVGIILKGWQKKQEGQTPASDLQQHLEKEVHKRPNRAAKPDTKRVEHLVPNVNQIVKVTVQTRWFLRCDSGVVTLALPLSTRISQVKEMEIFGGGRIQFPSDKFTLEYKGKELADDTILASIYSPGEDLFLKVHSFTVTIKEENGAWEFPLTFTLEEYKSRCKEIIEEHVQRLKGIQPDRVVENYYWRYPGVTIYISLR